MDTKTRLTAAQRELLESALYHAGQEGGAQCRGSRIRTSYALDRMGLVVAEYGACRITPAGRAALEEKS
jgi:hypothetical protein